MYGPLLRRAIGCHHQRCPAPASLMTAATRGPTRPSVGIERATGYGDRSTQEHARTSFGVGCFFQHLKFAPLRDRGRRLELRVNSRTFTQSTTRTWIYHIFLMVCHRPVPVKGILSMAPKIAVSLEKSIPDSTVYKASVILCPYRFAHTPRSFHSYCCIK